MSQSQKTDWVPVVLFVVLAIIWGSSFILMKRGLEAFSASQVAALRLSLAFLCMLPVGLKYLRKLPKEHLWPIMVVGLFGNGIPAFLFTAAETQVASSIVGILNATVPLFTLVVGVLFFKGQAKWMQAGGVAIGLLGASWLMFPEGIVFNGSVNIPYASLVLLATLCYAISANTISTYLKGLKAIQITTIGLGFAGIPATIYLFATDFTVVLVSHPQGWSSFGYTFILALFGTSIGVVLFNVLIQRSSAIFGASVTYLIPIVAIIWGLLDGEKLLGSQFIAVLVIVFGLYLTNRAKGKVKTMNK